LAIVLIAAGCSDPAQQPEDAAVDTWIDAGPPDTAKPPDVTEDTAIADEGPPADTTVGPLDDVLRIHHLQLRGTHNSYHVEPQFPVAKEHEYSHVPLDLQLEDLGVRAFELDLHLHDGQLRVYHLSFIDEISTCDTLSQCLALVVDWSAAHPAHLPVIVWLEVKDAYGGDAVEDLSIIDDTVRSGVPVAQLITPDDVRGNHADLRTALEADGWPTLAQARGKLLFVLLNGSRAEEYVAGDDTLAGKALFPRADPDDFIKPWAGFTKAGTESADEILAAAASRILVAGNTCNADDSAGTCGKALLHGLKNGLHMVMDDFPGIVEGRDYFLQFPNDALALCNPLTAPIECVPSALIE